MGAGAWCATAVLLLVAIPKSSSLAAAAEAEAETAACPLPSLADAILGRGDFCASHDDGMVGARVSPGFVEGDEVALQRALRIVHSNKEEYVAVLFYASWCPFSQICSANYNILSSLFPSIRHFAIEESAIRPSILSRYGVHGFPTLFLLNSTMRVRYHGSRTIASLVAFYTDVTGIQAASPYQGLLQCSIDSSNSSGINGGIKHESCPFPWARSPEKLFQQDTYLVLASCFVAMRLFYILLPKLIACIRRAWRRHIQYASLMSLWDYSEAYIEIAKQRLDRVNPCKRGNLQEGARNAKAWASKSLASVSIGEPSVGRTGSLSDRR